MSVKLTVVGCSPAWPNPGGAQSGYLVDGADGRRLLLDCGPGVLGKLRAASANGWPQVDAIVVTHWHLDHWGDLVPWVWGGMVGPGKEAQKPQLFLPPEGRERLREFGSGLGWEDMWQTVFELRDYVEHEPFEAASTSSSARRRSCAATLTARRGAISRSTKRSRRSRLRARSACCSRTDPSSCRDRTATSSPTTGSSSRSEGPTEVGRRSLSRGSSRQAFGRGVRLAPGPA